MEIIRHHNQIPIPGRAERAAALAAGTLLIARGVRKRGWGGTALALLGIACIRRSITGYGKNNHVKSPNTSVAHRSGIRIEEAVTINCPREEVYRFARDLENIAELAEHVNSVHVAGNGNRSHWTAKGPGEKRFELNAQIINEKENERIAWRSLDGSDVPNAGSVHFKDAAGGRGTEVHVEILYSPPGGTLGALVSRLSGGDPTDQVRRDLRRLKSRLEAGVLAETEGQPAGGHPLNQSHLHGDPVAKASEASFPASDATAFTH
jgi:uncharacterized membrane protein